MASPAPTRILKSQLLIAQNSLPNLDGEVPNLENPEQVIQDSQQILDDFNYEKLDYWEDLCNLFNQTRQIEKATQACQKVIELSDDDDPDIWLARGNNLFRSGEYVEAVASYNEALDISDNYSLALTYRCASYFQLALYEEAIADCETALEKDGDWKNGSPVLAWYFKGLALNRLGRSEAALINFERGISHSPENDLVYAERCRTLLILSKQESEIKPCIEDQAIARYEKSLFENSDDAIVLTNQGLFFEALGAEDKALNSYDRVLEILPQSFFVSARRCNVANQLKNYQEALSSCDLALEGSRIFNSSELALIWSQRSKALLGLEKYEEALNSAQKALAINGGIAEAWNNKGVALWYLEKPEEASITIERAINIEPEYTRALFNYGRILSSLERYQEALGFYNRALKTNEDEISKIDSRELADIWVNKSVASFNLNRCQEALEATQKAVVFNPNSFEAWYNQGLSLACLERYQLALDAYETANKLNPESPLIYTARAISLAELGFYQEALSTVEEALNIDKDYEPSITTRDFLINIINRRSQNNNL